MYVHVCVLRREKARDREELNSLISEIEQYIKTMDAPADASGVS